MAQPLRCPQCGTDVVLRARCVSLIERLAGVLLMSPFRCQICSHRFLSFRWGRRYPPHPVDRREHTRIPVRFALAFSGGRISGDGTVLNISAGGCLIRSDAPVRTDEIYYVIDGAGTMILDDEEIELHQGVVVYVPRGMKHKAIGRLTVLTVCIPRGVLNDVHEVE